MQRYRSVKLQKITDVCMVKGGGGGGGGAGKADVPAELTDFPDLVHVKS